MLGHLRLGGYATSIAVGSSLQLQSASHAAWYRRRLCRLQRQFVWSFLWSMSTQSLAEGWGDSVRARINCI